MCDSDLVKIIVLFVVLWVIMSGEGFATVQEKAEALSNWAKSRGGNTSYVDFRRNIATGNYVEYAAMKNIDTEPKNIVRELYTQ